MIQKEKLNLKIKYRTKNLEVIEQTSDKIDWLTLNRIETIRKHHKEVNENVKGKFSPTGLEKSVETIEGLLQCFNQLYEEQKKTLEKLREADLTNTKLRKEIERLKYQPLN